MNHPPQKDQKLKPRTEKKEKKFFLKWERIEIMLDLIWAISASEW